MRSPSGLIVSLRNKEVCNPIAHCLVLCQQDKEREASRATPQGDDAEKGGPFPVRGKADHDPKEKSDLEATGKADHEARGKADHDSGGKAVVEELQTGDGNLFEGDVLDFPVPSAAKEAAKGERPAAAAGSDGDLPWMSSVRGIQSPLLRLHNGNDLFAPVSPFLFHFPAV